MGEVTTRQEPAQLLDLKRKITGEKTTKTHDMPALWLRNIYVAALNHYIMRPVLTPY
jgi:hypothetical protein